MKTSERLRAIDQEVSFRLKQARQASGYTSARQFSQKHNLPKTTYWQHENGKRCLSAGYIYEYAKLLRISVQWLLTGEAAPVDNQYTYAAETETA